MMETMYKIQTLEKLIDSGMDDGLIGEIYGLDHEEIKYLIEYDKEIRTGDRLDFLFGYNVEKQKCRTTIL